MPSLAEITFPLILFAYQLLVAIAVGGLSGWVFSRVFLKGFTLDKREELMLGFALAPVLITIGGFVGIFRIPFAPEVLGYGATMVWIYRLKPSFLTIKRNQPWGLWAVAALGIGLLLIGKYCYFTGGLNNSDDMRSVLLTGAFATNDLKPAFPFDFSIPVSYSHYLFEMAAFLYATVNGAGFPAVSVVAVNVLAIFFFYQSLVLVSEKIFKKHLRLRQLLVALFLTFYGFDGFIVSPTDYHIEWWSPAQISQMASYAHWVYQYLLGGSLLLLSLLHLDTFVRTKERHEWILFCALFLTAAGHATITAVWTAPGLLPVFAWFIYRERARAILTWRSLFVVSVILTMLILGPQVWTFIGRDVIFAFSSAHPWYNALTIFGQAWNTTNTNILMILIEFGTFLLLGYIWALLSWAAPRKWVSHLPFGFVSVLATAILIRTFTTSPYFDWGARGLLVSMFIAAFFAADLVVPFLVSRKAWVRSLSGTLLVILLLPQAYTFTLEHRFRTRWCGQPSEEARTINRTYPLGTLFYEISGSLHHPIALAGRALLTPASPSLETYMNQKEFLEKTFDWYSPYVPCKESRFGKTTREGTYVMFDGTSYTHLSCPDELTKP